MADDSTDSAVKEQCGVYIICTKFLSLQRIVGHPDAENELCKFYIVTFLKNVITICYFVFELREFNLKKEEKMNNVHM